MACKLDLFNRVNPRILKTLISNDYRVYNSFCFEMITYIEYNQAFGSKLLLHLHELYVIVHPVDNELYIQFIYPDLYQHIVVLC